MKRALIVAVFAASLIPIPRAGLFAQGAQGAAPEKSVPGGIVVVDGQRFTYQTPREVASTARPAPAEGSKLRGFGITLVLGETQGAATTNLTPTATKALTDLKDFLPYKSYRLLDTAWTVGSGSQSRLRGVDAKDYDVYLRSEMLTPTVINVGMLRLWEATGDSRANELVARGLLSGRGQTPNPAVIDATFRMDVGETVVVGTSRLQGDRALILLVTAVAR